MAFEKSTLQPSFPAVDERQTKYNFFFFKLASDSKSALLPKTACKKTRDASLKLGHWKIHWSSAGITKLKYIKTAGLQSNDCSIAPLRTAAPTVGK